MTKAVWVMTPKYSLIGPAVFMDERGNLYKKASDVSFIPIKNKYTVAEDRYVQRNLEKKGRDN